MLTNNKDLKELEASICLLQGQMQHSLTLVEQMQVFVRQKQEKQIVLTMCQEIMRKHPDIFGNQPLYG